MNKLPKLSIFALLLDLGVTNLIDVLVYKILSLRGKYKKQITVDAIALRKRINKLCKKYGICDRTADRILKRLVKAGLINIIYNVQGFGKYVIEVIPLNEFIKHDDPGETDLSVPQKSATLEPISDTSDATKKTVVKQQQLILTKQICKSVGINYRLEEDWWEVASHGVDKLKATIERMLVQISSPSRTKIYNPCGWLKVALRKNYYLDNRGAGNPLSVYEQMYLWSKEKLLNMVGSVPTQVMQTKKTRSA